MIKYNRRQSRQIPRFRSVSGKFYCYTRAGGPHTYDNA